MSLLVVFLLHVALVQFTTGHNYTYGLVCMENVDACEDSSMCPEDHFCAGERCCEGEDGPCHDILAEYMAASSLIADDSPSCRFDGYFSGRQMHYFGVSYCVTPDGSYIPGSDTEDRLVEEDCAEYYHCPLEGRPTSRLCPEDGQCWDGEFCYNHRMCCKGERGPCIELVEEGSISGHHLLPGAFLHQCQADGTCLPIQCHSSAASCWCASADCTEISGTRERVFSEEEYIRLRNECEEMVEK